MKRLLIVLSILSWGLQAQTSRIYFIDKGANAAMLSNPYLFLSQQAIENKASRMVTIDLTDVPVSNGYLKKLKARGLNVKMTSRWLNYALVEGENVEEKVQSLPFVKRVEKPKQYKVLFAETPEAVKSTNLEYGLSENQIEMMEGEYLHNLDYRGAGMTIAVLDGGYQGAISQVGLDSLWAHKRVLGTYNFVDNDTNIFAVGSHGTKVLTIMAGFIDSLSAAIPYVGSAIDANYWLLKSEDESSETPAEMDNWLAAAEFADSVGADIITSSLGYNLFDSGVGYDYEDMDGNTTLVTKAADMAAAKGMLVVVSAGNEGNDTWQHITAPADGDSVMAVGGVDNFGSYVSFSSTGPTADNRIKPDVVAVAGGTAYIATAGPTYGNGTSFSCPIISGMAACLWQQMPTLTNMEIFQAIIDGASQPYTPDNLIGFGIPNFRVASWTISEKEEILSEKGIRVFPNPVGDVFEIESSLFQQQEWVDVSIININGQLVYQEKVAGYSDRLEINPPLEEGIYILNVQIGGKSLLQKIIK